VPAEFFDFNPGNSDSATHEATTSASHLDVCFPGLTARCWIRVCSLGADVSTQRVKASSGPCHIVPAASPCPGIASTATNSAC
jgi:hypothetical protein